MMIALTSFTMLVSMVQADPAFFCTFKENAEFKRVGDLEFYQSCGERCDCQIQELVCLKAYGNKNDEKVEFTLESESVEYAENCPTNECICNNDYERWNEQTVYANVEDITIPLPLTPQVDIAPFEQLNTSSDLYKYITKSSFANTVIPHEINNGKPSAIAAVTTNPEVPTIPSNCTAEAGSIMTVKCDLYYTLDWSSSFTTEVDIDCQDIDEDEFKNDGPCFASQACICDNRYFRISQDMPLLSEEETKNVAGDVDVTVFEDAIAIVEEEINLNLPSISSDDDDDNTVVIVVAVVVPIVVCICCGVAGFLIFRSMSKTKDNESKTRIEPMSLTQNSQITDVDSAIKDNSAI